MRRLPLACPWLLASAACAACAACADGADLTRLAPLLEPEHLDFGDVILGRSLTRELSLHNRSPVSLAITSLAIDPRSAPFTLSPPRADLAPGETATLPVTFEPEARGEASADLAIEVGGVSLHATVRGRALRQTIDLITTPPSCPGSSRSLALPLTRPSEVGTRSFEVELTGDGHVTLATARVEGSFAITTPLPLDVDAEHSATIELAFAPLESGDHRGRLELETAAGVTKTLDLCGFASAAQLCVDPPRLDYGDVMIDRAITATVTLSNCGDDPLSRIEVSSSPDLEARGLSAGLEPAASAAIPVRFTPRQRGAFAGEITWSAPFPGTPLILPVSANVVPACALRLAPDRVVFSPPPFEAQERSGLLYNAGDDDCVITALELPAGGYWTFVSRPELPLTLPPRRSMQVDLRFFWSNGAPIAGALEVTTRGGQQWALALEGNPPIVPGACEVDALPGFFDFGVTVPGGSVTRAIMLHDRNGSGRCKLTNARLATGAPPSLELGAWTSSSLPWDAPYPLQLTHAPLEPEQVATTLIVEVSDPWRRFEVPIFAGSAERALCIEPAAIDFGRVAVGAEATATLRVSACGETPVRVFTLRADPENGDLIAALPAAPLALARGESLSFEVRYRPSDAFEDRTAIVFRSDDFTEPERNVLVSGAAAALPAGEGSTLVFWRVGAAGELLAFEPLSGLAPRALSIPGASGSCRGCHSISPDGRYLAFVERPRLRIWDRVTDLVEDTGIEGSVLDAVAWNPNTATQPPHQFAYAGDDGAIWIGAAGQGAIAAWPNLDVDQIYRSPQWAPSGELIAVRAARDGFSDASPADLVRVPAAGGGGLPIPGASLDGLIRRHPRLSDDGRWVAFTTHAPLGDAQWLGALRLDTGAIAPLMRANRDHPLISHPTWSRTGRVLSYTAKASAGDSGDLYLLPFDPDSGDEGSPVPMPLVNTSTAYEGRVAWID